MIRLEVFDESGAMAAVARLLDENVVMLVAAASATLVLQRIRETVVDG